jgi:branched-chain amino acid transport system permease protein
MLFNAVLSGALGFLTTRLVGDYLVVATLGLHYVVVAGVLPNWQELTGGYAGLFGIPKPEIFGWRVEAPWHFAVLTCGLALAIAVLFHHLGRSWLGIALPALRDDEISATSLGYPTAMLKSAAFVIASSVCALAGGLYAAFIGYIDPPTFNISLIVLVLAMVVVGGSGTILGPALGAFLLVALPDTIVFVSRTTSSAVGPLRQIAYGLALIVFVLMRPSGILPAALPRWRKRVEQLKARS